MNDLGLIVLGLAARSTALALIGLAVAALLRRRGPSAGALASSTTLAVLVGLTALALSPWPRWWPPVEVAGRRPTESEAPAPAGVETPTEPGSTNEPKTAPTASTAFAASATWSDFVREFAREMTRPTDPAGSSTWRWPAWVGVGFLAGLLVALARLGLGVWAVRTLRGRSRLVDDPALLELAARLRADLGLARAVELRETLDVGTPATVGWRRPAVLLPKGWSDWDEPERRAVLAHELAHVARGDYLVGLAAQVSLSLHFYHPLVHALARRLRLQQELAADAWGARLSGGRRAYLTTLANLALRQEPRPSAWPARPFLPTRGTFLRRIEMLRDPNALQQAPWPARGRAATVTGLALLGLLVAGFRGPGGSTPALAQEAPAAKKGGLAVAQAPKLLDPASASSDARLVIEIRPAALLKNPDVKKLAERYPATGLKLPLAILSGQIEQVIVLGFDRKAENYPRNYDLPPQLAVILRSNRPMDWKPLMPADAKEVQGGDGISYFRSGPGTASTCSRVLDDSTLLIGTEADVLLPPIGPDRPRSRHDWDEAWHKLEPSPIGLAFDTAWLVKLSQPNGPQVRPGAFSPVSSLFGPLLDKARAYALTLDVADGLALEARATCDSDQGAGRVADTVRACIALGRNALPDLRTMAAGGPPQGARPLNDLIDALDAMLETAKVEQDRSVALLHARADAISLTTALRLLPPVAGASQQASRRAQCVNNLKQIALAMHNFHAANDCFPPAVLYGPDGKTPYSWRVALLPYLEHADLYNQYKFDEPWDGPNNIKLLAMIPGVYRDPSFGGDVNPALAPNRTLTNYFVLKGPDTMFPDRKEGTGLREVIDGTSNTILVVEAVRDIPWTKPEDIPYAADKAPPAIGGLHPNGFNASLSDGAVRFFKDTINPILLRALISRAGGEVIDTDQF